MGPKKKTTKTRNKGLSMKDAQIEYLTQGADAFMKLLRDGLISQKVAKDAAAAIQARNPDVPEALSALLAKAHPGQRGRASAEAGETRVYKAQQVGDRLFLPLPVHTLAGIKKGSGIRVTFGTDKLVLEKASAAAAAPVAAQQKAAG